MAGDVSSRLGGADTGDVMRDARRMTVDSAVPANSDTREVATMPTVQEGHVT